ncbi:MAG: hypothetical protein AB9891_16955 [Anaerolineaceae bacterium]
MKENLISENSGEGSDSLSIFGINSESEENQIIHRLSFFSPEGSGDYIRALQEFVTIQVLSMLPSGHHSTHEIFQKICGLLGNRFEYEEVFRAIERLVNKGDIRSTKNIFEDPDNRFDLQVEKRNTLHQQVQKEKELESLVLTEWKENLRKKYKGIKNEILDQLELDIKICAFRFLSIYSVEALELYYGNDEKLNEVIRTIEGKKFLEKSSIIPESFEDTRTIEVYDFFLKANERRKQYIASLIHSIFLFYLTQLDLSCSVLMKKDLIPGKIYLDTNFVFALVGLSGPDMHFASQRLVRLTKDLGFIVAVSLRTQSEYEHSLRSVLKEIKGNAISSKELADLALRASKDHDFYSLYWEEVSKDTGVHVDAQVLFDYYINLDAILEDRGVIIDNTFHEEINQQTEEISKEASKLRSVMETTFGPEIGDKTSQYVLDHDAYHRLLILKYREGIQKESFINSKAFFLTLDSKLPIYDRVARGSNPEKLPFCVMSGQWIQLIRPYASGNGDIDSVQVNLVVSPLMRAYPKPPNKTINSVITFASASSNFAPKAVTKMLSERNFMEQFEASKTQEAKIDLVDSFYAEYAEEVEKRLHEAELRGLEAEKDREKIETEFKKLEFENKALRKKNEGKKLHNKLNEELLGRQREEISALKEQIQNSSKTQDDGRNLEKQSSDQNTEKFSNNTKDISVIFLKFIIPFTIILPIFTYRKPWLLPMPNSIYEILLFLLALGLGVSIGFNKIRKFIIILILVFLFLLFSIIYQREVPALTNFASVAGIFGIIYTIIQNSVRKTP